MEEKIKQTIFISYNSSIANVVFQPNALIVKSIEFLDGGTGSSNLALLYSDLVSNKPLVFF